MSKTLTIILHYNTAEMTDGLCEQLKPYEGDDCKSLWKYLEKECKKIKQNENRGRNSK